MKILVYDTIGWGHHIEYIHHLYMYAGEQRKDDQFVFALSDEFSETMKNLHFPNYDNVKVLTIHPDKPLRLQGRWMKQWTTCYKGYRLLKHYIEMVKPDRVVLNTLFNYMPFLALEPKHKKLVSGILYIIPRRKSAQTTSRWKRWSDDLRMRLYAKGRIFNDVFLLNDPESPDIYNRKYKTHVFKYLPDPTTFSAQPETCCKTVPESGKITFLHFGGMGERKGTFDILDAIEQLTDDELKQSKFIFAGRIVSNPETYKHFIDRIDKLKRKSLHTNIVFQEGFLPFDQLDTLLEQADYILVPYKNTEQSSGVISHAARFSKPVIGPKEGLLGYLIDTYCMGHSLERINGETLAIAFKQAIAGKLPSIANPGISYLKECTPQRFAACMFGEQIRPFKKEQGLLARV